MEFIEEIKIKNVDGHYEGFLNGKFIVSGDTYTECMDDIIKYMNKNES